MEVENTETIGLWTEKIICEIYGITFNCSRDHIKNLNIDIQDFKENLKELIKNIKVTEHLGHLNKNVDFKTSHSHLSIKTNIANDKVCPNSIGQTSLKNLNFNTNLDFKEWIINKPILALQFYLYHILTEDLLYINYNKGKMVFIPSQTLPKIDIKYITFTKTLETFKESCTMKYKNKSIAEFQCHNTRNIIKCRFSMLNLLDLLKHTYKEFATIKFKVKKTIGSFNYIGSKTKLLNFIYNSVQEYTNNEKINTFYDLFGGTGCVSRFFLENGYKNIINNDNMKYGYVLCSSIVKTNINKEKVKSYIKVLNNLEPLQGYIYNSYAKSRMYFTEENAMKIDAIMNKLTLDINCFTLEEYNFILKCILYASSKIANISSTFGAFLKKYKISSKKPIKILDSQLDTLLDGNLISYNEDILSFVNKEMEQNSICYLDPPYNTRKYSSNYFVLESIARNDKREISNGITGIPVEKDAASGMFCSKTTVTKSFTLLFNKISSKYLFMSYSSESLLSIQEIISLLEKSLWKNIIVKEKEYKRFNSNKNTKNSNITEYLFCATKN